jgi:transcription elongation factor GreA
MQDIKDQLTSELKALEHEFRVELPKEIKTAVAMGDLRENAEYHAALERQAYVKARISQLRERLGTLNSINMGQLPRDRAGLGSRLLLLDLDSDAEVTYELVFPEVANLEQGLISIASPIGKSLVGKQAGDEVEIRIPSGSKRFEILELATAHDLGDGDGS